MTCGLGGYAAGVKLKRALFEQGKVTWVGTDGAAHVVRWSEKDLREGDVLFDQLPKDASIRVAQPGSPFGPVTLPLQPTDRSSVTPELLDQVRALNPDNPDALRAFATVAAGNMPVSQGESAKHSKEIAELYHGELRRPLEQHTGQFAQLAAARDAIFSSTGMHEELLPAVLSDARGNRLGYALSSRFRNWETSETLAADIAALRLSSNPADVALFNDIAQATRAAAYRQQMQQLIAADPWAANPTINFSSIEIYRTYEGDDGVIRYLASQMENNPSKLSPDSPLPTTEALRGHMTAKFPMWEQVPPTADELRALRTSADPLDVALYRGLAEPLTAGRYNSARVDFLGTRSEFDDLETRLYLSAARDDVRKSIASLSAVLTTGDAGLASHAPKETVATIQEIARVLDLSRAAVGGQQNWTQHELSYEYGELRRQFATAVLEALPNAALRHDHVAVMAGSFEPGFLAQLQRDAGRQQEVISSNGSVDIRAVEPWQFEHGRQRAAVNHALNNPGTPAPYMAPSSAGSVLFEKRVGEDGSGGVDLRDSWSTITQRYQALVADGEISPANHGGGRPYRAYEVVPAGGMGSSGAPFEVARMSFNEITGEVMEFSEEQNGRVSVRVRQLGLGEKLKRVSRTRQLAEAAVA